MTAEEKQQWRDRLEAWLAAQDAADAAQENEGGAPSKSDSTSTVDSLPSSETATPDLYAFYESLVALRAEVRTGNRKVAEVLTRFQTQFTDLSASLEDTFAEQSCKPDQMGSNPEDRTLTQSQIEQLIEVLESLNRMLKRAEEPLDSANFWSQLNGKALQAREQRLELLREGLRILRAKTQTFQESIELETLAAHDRPFDPECMVAIDFAEEAGDFAPRVLEVIQNGYFHQGKLVQVAKVKVLRPQRSQ